MEPMTLGSPSGSPAANTYLPAFLMGETQMTTPRTLSPNKAGRNISFASPSTRTSPQDYNRSALGQKTLFGGYQETVPPCVTVAPGSCSNTSLHSGHSGPPTQGLFDSLHNERNQVQTPTRNVLQSGLCSPLSAAAQQNISAYGMNQQQHPPAAHQSFNDSYLNSASFNASMVRGGGVTSPLAIGPGTPVHMLQCPAPRYTDFWVTVFGFPPSAVSTVLQHFGQCGTIVEKVFPPQNGNWMHMKFSSRLECDKALNYNEKILGNNIMIGVTQCKDRNIIDKEHLGDSNNLLQPTKVRPLAQTAYKSAQNDSAVLASPSAPQKSTGFMDRAMDLFFGW